MCTIIFFCSRRVKNEKAIIDSGVHDNVLCRHRRSFCYLRCSACTAAEKQNDAAAAQRRQASADATAYAPATAFQCRGCGKTAVRIRLPLF
ncbi:DUF3795 domain-containing protein [Phascolarctobacterium succinatutens]|uniref:DUF3795 domain-containing protein n=1 Tax=Phascolarctobacterium succinatutens TaxID=626940 RepID=UPI003463FB21